MCVTLAELNSLLRGNGSVNSRLYFLNGDFAAPVYKRGDIKSFTGMVEHVVCDGTRKFSKNITEDIIKLQVGNSQAVQSTVFITGDHVGEFGAVTHEIAEQSDFGRRDKAGFYHVAHEEVVDPFGVLAVGLVPPLRFHIFRMGKGDKTGFFEGVEYRDPIRAG